MNRERSGTGPDLPSPMPVDSIAIRARGLTKRFGTTVAVDRLDLEVKRGELFGMVGPDGAGKTTTMRLLAGIMRPTEGEAWVAGHPVVGEEEALKEKIGYMSQRFGLYEDLTVMENLLFYADLYDVPEEERAPAIERLLAFSNLAPFTGRLAGNLSGGMKQKLGLACALIHRPEVLLLDEPTGGVDPVSRRDFWRILYGLVREGVTVFVSTAYLDEAERCGRIGLINKGAFMVTDEPRRLRAGLGGVMIEVQTPDTRRAAGIAGESAQVRGVSVYGDRLHISLASRDDVQAVVGGMTAAGITVTGTRAVLPSLEDVFIALVKRSDGSATGEGR